MHHSSLYSTGLLLARSDLLTQFIRRLIMLYQLFIPFFLVVGLTACSKDRHIDIEVADVHLEQIPAGRWLSIFNLGYAPGAGDIKKQIVSKLRTGGRLLDEYRHEENSNVVTTRVWTYSGHTIKEEYYQGGIWRGPKIIPYQEYYQGESPVWITVEFKQGIPYTELLPQHHQKTNLNRKYEHTATIKSLKDRARLFLFGYGTSCQRISLF